MHLSSVKKKKTSLKESVTEKKKIHSQFVVSQPLSGAGEQEGREDLSFTNHLYCRLVGLSCCFNLSAVII